MAKAEVQGFVNDKFEGVRDQFQTHLDTGADIGASFCVTKDGETVVDLWGGYADVEKTRPWEKDTIVNVYSTTKTMTALTALLLADRGELDFDAPVAKYWPEFGANGKADIKFSHLMSHSAGLSGWREPMTNDDLYDWEKATSLLAAQAPLWAPGTAPGYHAITQGYLVGEVIRRVAGKSVGTLFREEIAGPLGADFHIGLPASEDARVADLKPPADASISADPTMTDIKKVTFTNPGIDVSETRTRAWRGAEIPAAGGTGNARSVATIHTILANGGMAGGKRFMSEAGCRKALEEQIQGTDLILGIPVRYGLGFGLSGPMSPALNAHSMFWGGYGGSIALIDMESHTTMSYAMNLMQGTTTGDMRAITLAMQAWQGLNA
ncbi:MAG: beta-lactamase family protein [Alphaproteobacteria bacterium]|nr:beta-lactamase family protein [Alphaproteobacteria bacterium]MBU2084452.1 beta-lactamase family protein [Alphaproteobacteria bacterium]MBU2142460.1 beta-lactamase family protein [Alphaproteobacteria bacterium]MBU2197787.1 beta-lactamase family protein [Alphaproteobacteria bacterium]